MSSIFREMKPLLRLGLPLMGAQFFHIAMFFVDNVMVGRLGEKPLAAMAVATSFSSFWVVAGIGLLGVLSAFVGQAFGRDARPEVGRLLRQGVWIALGMSVVTAVAFQFATFTLLFLKQSEELVQMALPFLNIVIWAIPAQLLFVVFRQASEATSDSVPSVLIAGIGLFTNFAADYVLIYGKFGMPQLEIRGAALATVAASWIMFLLLLLYLKFNQRYAQFEIFSGSWRPNFNDIVGILKVGFPSCATMMAEVSYFLGTTFIAGAIGATQLASHQMALNAASLTFMIPLGLSFAVSIRVSQAFGRGDREGLRAAGFAGAFLGVLISSFATTLFVFFPELVAGLYTSDEKLIAHAVVLIRIAGFFQFFDGLQVLGVGALRGLKETRIPFLTNLLAYWALGLPLGWYLAFPKSLGTQGIWTGMLVSLVLAAVLHQLRFYATSMRLPLP